MAIRRLAWISLLVLGACQRPDPRQILAHTPRLAGDEGGVRLVPYPCSRHGELVAPVEVAGVPTWLLVDTGAYEHALTPELVASAGLAPPPSRARIFGGAGVEVPLHRAVSMSFPGLGALVAGRALELPLADLDACGTGGVLSPSRLETADRAVVLDLGGRSLRRVPKDGALDARDEGAGGVMVRRAARDGYEAFTTTATVAGVTTRLELDTGACCTAIRARTTAGVRLVLEAEAPTLERPRALDGAAAIGRVRGARVRIGEVERITDAWLLEGESQPGSADGVVGIDVLAGCTLVFHDGLLDARCPKDDGRRG
jgi:hypothetical protein